MSNFVPWPNWFNINKSAFPHMNMSWTWPDSRYPGRIVSTEQAATFKVEGTKSFPGISSSPRLLGVSDPSRLFQVEHVIIPQRGSVLTRSNFILGAGCNWVGTTGLTARNTNPLSYNTTLPQNCCEAVNGILPCAQGRSLYYCINTDGSRGGPGTSYPPTSICSNFLEVFSDNCNHNYFQPTGTEIKGVNTSDQSLYFKVATRLVMPTWQGVARNFYYTSSVISDEFYIVKQVPPPPPAPTVSFRYSYTYPSSKSPYVITRVDRFAGSNNSRRMVLKINNVQNIPSGSTFNFQIIPVNSSNVTKNDFAGINWSNASQLKWTRTTSGTAGDVITETILGAGRRQANDRFKVKITYQPPPYGSSTYSPIVVYTPVYTISNTIR